MISLLEFEFPDTGEGVTEGTFLEWLVDEGEEVEEDQTVAEVETDKAVVDVPAPVSGVVKELRAEPGDKVEVGQVIMVLDDGESGDDKEAKEESGPETEDGAEETEEVEEVELDEESEEKEESDNTDSSSRDVLALPKVRKLAEDKGVDLSKVEGSGPEGRITEADVEGAAGEGTAEVEEKGGKEVEEDRQEETGEKETNSVSTPDSVKATPAVRKLAREKGVDIASVEGSGRGGKITREDVLSAAGDKGKESGVNERSGPKGVTTTKEGESERIEMSGTRKAIAEKMEESRFTAPHVTHVEKADVSQLVELREEKKENVDAHLTYLPFIMKAAMLALKEYPELNAELDEDEMEIVEKKHYDFNIAVDTERGLMVPVVENVDDKNILQLAEDISDVAEKAQEGELSPKEMEGGTFSITNLGVIGGEEFTPIINYPQTAILGIGKISETAEVVDEEVTPRHTVKLSLSYDHRVVDGATAARFMNKLVENLEDPEHMLMEL